MLTYCISILNCVPNLQARKLAESRRYSIFVGKDVQSKRSLNWCKGKEQDKKSEFDELFANEADVTEGIRNFVQAKTQVRHELEVVNTFRKDQKFASIKREIKRKAKDYALEEAIQEQ